MMKTRVLGIGNPIIDDDAVSVITADKVKEKNLKNMDVETEKIMEELT
ncbi:MAG: hypothetical protein QMC80_08050 [Thermoplasmatales archaeon]|nr:hypothetical protein [Thermoplasmatales archaeon]